MFKNVLTMMRNVFSLAMISGVLLAGAVLPVGAQEKAAAVQPEEPALPGLSEKEVRSYISKSKNRKALLRWYLTEVDRSTQKNCGDYVNNIRTALQEKQQQIEKLQKEAARLSGPEAESTRYRLKQATREKEALQEELARPQETPGSREIRQALMQNEAWMRQVAFSGELHQFRRVLQIMAAIAEKDKAALNKGVERDITTATALEYARNGWSVADAVARAGYFLKYQRQGRLNTSFDSLPMHQRRVACGWKNNHSSGTVKAFEWALNNVHLPDSQYPASCWRCGYILDNVFGDSIHGPWYAAPFVGVYSDNHMAFTKNVGGVCGGLSHFGAASACANGVPALTAGEPGHCAYIVLVNGKWTPAYSLSWERGLHWIPWSDNWTYSALHLTDALYAAERADNTQVAQAYRVMARLYRGKGEADKALRCFEASARLAPFNYPMWREYSAFLADRMLQNKAAWKKLNAALCAGMAPEYPEQAAELLRRYVYNHLAAAGFSPEERAELCVEFWKQLRGMGPDRWRIEDMANDQLNLCRKDAPDAEKMTGSLYLGMLSAVAANDTYSGTMMAWGNGVAEKLSDSGKKTLTEAMIQAFSGNAGLDSAQRARLLGSLILRAEQARDESTFHAISRMIDPKEIHGTAAIPAPTPFPGKLVSEGGMPFASSTSQWDAPHTHSGLLTQAGGRIHTGKDTNAWIAVKLPRHAYITGVVFAGTNEWSLINRFRPLQIQVSDTGRDDDWHNVGSPIPNTPNYINRFDLQNERPKALYIRVLRPGGPEFFHANGIYVYGEQAA
ncbi:MAG: hypothetical protein IJ498_09980 [Akkermansia sp.]|nr:hypothetical protein [Akkermansia sp.]